MTAPDADELTALSERARLLRNVLEPLASNVYFARDVHEAFERLGFGPGVTAEGCVTIAEPSGYYCSRAACMGQVPGDVVVAAFGVFNPRLIIPAVERGWSIATADQVLQAREAGATASYERVLGDQADELATATAILERAAHAGTTAGRFLYAGLRSLPVPASPWGRLWRFVDMVREHRGDSHIAAWISAGFDPVEIGLVTELYYGMTPTRYHRGRGWTDGDIEAARDRLRRGGLVTADALALTERGRQVRDAVEVATDLQQRAVLGAIGTDFDALVAMLRPWAAAIIADGGMVTSIDQIPPQWGRLDD